MGQHHSSQIQDIISPLLFQFMSEEPAATLLTEDIHNLSYEQFEALLSDLNKLSKDWLDSDGKRLVFAIRKGSAATLFWKATVQIGCVKVDPETMKVDTYRLLSLSELIKVVKTLKVQSKAVEQSQSNKEPGEEESFTDSHNDSQNEPNQECCICFERKHEVILPCAHSFCSTCVEEWNESHDTCPICREKLESTDDTWILSEVPKAEEISEEMKSGLMELTEERNSPCATS